MPAEVGLRDPIAALSSPPGASPWALVRVAGEGAFALCARVFSPFPQEPWRLVSGALALPGWPPVPARCLGARAPRSYTGQDQVELYLPGAPPLIEAVLAALQAEGARLAERGEFTRRAFHSGRLDLVQVEAVLAMTSAASAEEARGALRALEGGVGRRIDAAKQTVAEVVAHVEAAIDFSEEELDLAEDAALAARLDAVAADLATLERESAGRASQSHLPRIVLRGPANAGKSTLFNALTQGAALVSPRAGTTRDLLERRWRCGAREVLLVDTAGTDESLGGAVFDDASETERAAAREADASAAGADAVVWVASGGEPPPAGLRVSLVVASQRDRSGLPRRSPGALAISAQSGLGLAELEVALERVLGESGAAAGSPRQARRVQEAREALGQAAALLRSERADRSELAALDLADALTALGRVTGEVTTEDVLGRIFASFCIGK